MSLLAGLNRAPCKRAGEFSITGFQMESTETSSASIEYDGEFEDRFLHGKGIIKDPSGTVYEEGDFQRGAHHRYGKCHFTNQDSYSRECTGLSIS